MSGAGNDFVVVDDRRHVFPRPLAKWARRLCCRQEGIGADGLLLMEKSRRAAFRMLYFNADGSRAAMCGNGARCLAWFAHEQGLKRSRFSFETDRGLVGAEVHDREVEIVLGDARDYRVHQALKAGNKLLPVSFIIMGVPHAVCVVRRLDGVEIVKWGRALRFHRAFQPAGANVNFVQRVNAHALRVRTYERGVEAETLACGTGVVASAVVAGLKGLVRPPVTCLTRGGESLVVCFRLIPGRSERLAADITLRGPVRLTFKGRIEVNS